MRRLLNALTEWQYSHSSRRTRDRIDWLESRVVAMETVLDRFPVTLSTEEREVRELVRKVCANATLEGREALDWLAGLSAEKLAVVLQRAADRTRSDAETVADRRPADAEGQR